MPAPTLQRLWQLCWHDPDADESLAAHYRAQQLRGVARHLPLASLATYLLVASSLFVAWNLAPHALLVLWSLTLCSLASANLLIWWRWGRGDAAHPVSPLMARLLALDLSLGALLYAGLTVSLFNVLDDHDRVIIAAVAAAFIATGAWMFASLPGAAFGWVLCFCAGIGAGLALYQWERYGLLVVLLAFYGVMLAATALINSSRFIAGLMAQTQIGEQRRLLDLLLRDFEANASDWLWETDRQGRLSHVSVRLAEATGLSQPALAGRYLSEVLSQLIDADDSPSCAALADFERRLDQMQPFSDLVVGVQIDGEPCWWTLSAKPLIDTKGEWRGWRGIGADISEVRRRDLELTQRANFDALTGLANRHQFSTRLAAQFDGPPSCSLMLLDLDNFKTVNDSLGHAAGDELLCRVASRLAEHVPPQALLARLGGDEFALLLPWHLDASETSALAERMQQGIRQLGLLDGHRLDVRVSIGVAFAPDDATQASDLLRACDLALYAAKAAGRNVMRCFEPELQQRALSKLEMLGEMQSGLERGEFMPFFQPQFDVDSGTLVGFEALVRWRHPTRGMIPPLDFIPLAEESGLILPLGQLILRQSCQVASRWPASLRVAVNVAAAQFEQSDLHRQVARVLEETGLAPQRLELELTESALMQSNAAVLGVLDALRASGVTIALDDFGTGFSSLAYLRSMPLDKLKIDKSFVHALARDDAERSAHAIVAAIAQLALALKLEVTAEGIESQAQLDAVRRVGCRYAQGYLFERPLNAEEASALALGSRAQPVPLKLT